jgi:hypothetical protein
MILPSVLLTHLLRATAGEQQGSGKMILGKMMLDKMIGGLL